MVNLLTFLLYLIEILHQTTTCGKCEDCLRRCILLKFYIKPQLYSFAWPASWCCILLKFYIKPQLVVSAKIVFAGCILLKFYIKPQLPFNPYILYVVVSY